MRPSLLPISGLKAGRSYFQLFLQFLKERRKEFLLLQSCLCQYVKDLFPLFQGQVENNGFEPLTPCLQSRCSSQLS